MTDTAHIRHPFRSFATPAVFRAVPATLITTAALLLAAEPTLWLVGTWRDPAYPGGGVWVFAAVLAMLAWSATSPLRIEHCREQTRTSAWALLAASALVRLIGQIAAVNTIGAICLICDVLAIGLLLRLDQRERAVSPLWLAVVFAFSLPLERILQRTLGYGLQHLSADGACLVLGTIFDGVSCQGVRIAVAGRDVLVDLPCSGARALLLCLLGFAILAAITRPTARYGVAGLTVTVLAALAANILRIVVLAIGIARPGWFGGADVMSAPWHDLIGLAALTLALLPVLAWSSAMPRRPPAVCRTFGVRLGAVPSRIANDGWWLPVSVTKAQSAAPGQRPGVTLAVACAALAIALIIVHLPRRAVDVARTEAPISLPLSIDGHTAQPVAISPRERAFFTQFGGTAAKAVYGANALMVIRTSSPLRHLHTPDECLRGLGFVVAYRGMTFAPVPTAVYDATAPDGARYRIDVSFVSDRGEITTNVATAVWRWLEGRARSWTAVQRITPATSPEGDRQAWDRAVATALELPLSPDVAIAKGVAR
ncbi:MAG: exosortase T [Hyphomicrobiaceae bacterium]|nr:exosortase T [Hyphomicrobiaceae bacterium]